MTVEESKTLKTGDIVKLNSGSPEMTIFEIQNNLLYLIYWDATNGLIHQTKGGFDYSLFTKVDKVK